MISDMLLVKVIIDHVKNTHYLIDNTECTVINQK